MDQNICTHKHRHHTQTRHTYVQPTHRHIFMHMHIYAWMCVHICTYIQVCIRALQTYTCLCMHTLAHPYVHTHGCAYNTNIHVSVCARTQVHIACTHAGRHLPMYVHTQINTCTRRSDVLFLLSFLPIFFSLLPFFHFPHSPQYPWYWDSSEVIVQFIIVKTMILLLTSPGFTLHEISELSCAPGVKVFITCLSRGNIKSSRLTPNEARVTLASTSRLGWPGFNKWGTRNWECHASFLPVTGEQPQAGISVCFLTLPLLWEGSVPALQCALPQARKELSGVVSTVLGGSGMDWGVASTL